MSAAAKAGLATFLVLWGLFALAPVRQLADSHYTCLVASRVVSEGDDYLESYLVPPMTRERFPGLRPVPDRLRPKRWQVAPYQWEEVNAHLVYRYPLGTPLLVAPLVAALRPFGISPIGSDGGYGRKGERDLQGLIAPFLAALGGLALYLIALRFLVPGSAMLITLGVALGSPLLSTASRGLWSHTGGLVPAATAVAVALWMPQLPRPAATLALGSLCAWAIVCRPTFVVTAVAIAFYLLRRRPRDLILCLVSALAWTTAFAAYFFSTRAELAPTYFLRTDLSGSRLSEAILGQLVSPSRGLIVYCPWVILCGLLALPRRIFAEDRIWLQACVGTGIAHWLLISRLNAWHAGSAYGPRLWTDLLPWFAILASLAAAQLGFGRSKSAGGSKLGEGERGLAYLTLAVAFAWSIAVHGVGAFSQRSWDWNGVAASRVERYDRAWDWRQAQFLSPWLSMPKDVDLRVDP